MVKPKQKNIFVSFFHQNFSLPSDSIIYYIAKNPRTSTLYEKMIKTCKYFFIKNPILVISSFSNFGDSKWEFSFKKHRIDISKITSKLWITDKLIVRPENFDDKKVLYQNILSSVMPKIYHCYAKNVVITDQIISFHDLLLLFSCAEFITLINLTAKDEIIVPFEKAVGMAVKAKKIYTRFLTNFLNFTSKTMKEFLKIPHFLKLNELALIYIPEVFDLETFYSYMKKNKTTKLWLRFDNSISGAYKNRLEEIIDEILATETFDYKPPYIYFTGLDREKHLTLEKIYYSHYFV